MPGRASTIVVIPCFNEAQRLRKDPYRAYLAQPDAAHLLFVDDGSTDRTVQVLEEICSGFEERASILRSVENKGKAEAVRIGLQSVIREQNSDLVGYWDADLATPLDAISQFIELFRRKPQVEMVFGSRIKLLGRDVRRSLPRHYLGRVFATAASAVLELPIYDTQCGAKLFRADPMLERVLEQPFLSRWVFDVELIARYRVAYGLDSHALESVICEFPLESWHDISGSKVRPRDFLIALLDLVKIRAHYLRGYDP